MKYRILLKDKSSVGIEAEHLKDAYETVGKLPQYRTILTNKFVRYNEDGRPTTCWITSKVSRELASDDEK